jgi:hypothetical protein
MDIKDAIRCAETAVKLGTGIYAEATSALLAHIRTMSSGQVVGRIHITPDGTHRFIYTQGGTKLPDGTPLFASSANPRNADAPFRLSPDAAGQLWLKFLNGAVCLDIVAEELGPITRKNLMAAIAAAIKSAPDGTPLFADSANPLDSAMTESRPTPRHHAEVRADFAKTALAGMLASASADWDIGADKAHNARQAVEYADALIKELK